MSARGAKKTGGEGKNSYPVGDGSKGQVHGGKVIGYFQGIMLRNSLFAFLQQHRAI